MQGSIDTSNFQHRLKRLEEKFDSGWLLNELGGVGTAEWRNVHLGNDPTDPTDNLTHSLDTNLSHLIPKVLISTDGTDNNSFEVNLIQTANAEITGVTFFQIDTNNITIQTGSGGIRYIDNAGASQLLDIENWYYKIVVGRL